MTIDLRDVPQDARPYISADDETLDWNVIADRAEQDGRPSLAQKLRRFATPVKFLYKAGEHCKFDHNMRYVDRCDLDGNGFMAPTCHEIDGMIVPADKAQDVADALNKILGECPVPLYMRR